LFDYLDLFERAPASVVLVASDRPGGRAMQRAADRGIATAVISYPADGDALLGLLDQHKTDLLVLAGYLKLVPAQVTHRYRGAVVNIHPALLPKFGGPGMHGRRVHEAVIASGERESGATAHFVDDEYDRGAPIACAKVPVLEGDTPAVLAERVLAAEHVLYPRVIHALACGLVSLAADGRVTLDAQLAAACPVVNRSSQRISFFTNPSVQL
jgi:formyltetrahydrofolate-dependent phosphoribosylglycinamide formyltransferase